MKKRAILIVEDEMIIALNVKSIVERLGYEVGDIVISGEEAIESARALQPNLVIMDVRLAGEIDGIEAAAAICGEMDVPIIFMTAQMDDATLRRLIACEPYGMIAKPIRIDELLTIIETALARHDFEKRLFESESRYRALVETTPNGMVEISADGVIVFCNCAFAEMTGFSVDELTGSWAGGLMASINIRTRFNSIISDLLAAETLSSSTVCELKLKSGGEIFAQVDWSRKRDEKGRNVAFLAVIKNITNLMEAERELKSQAKLLDLTHDSIIVRDMNDTIVFWNRGAREQYGWSADEAKGRITHLLMKTVFPKPLAEIKADLIVEGKWEGELVHTKKNGARITVSSRWALQKDHKGLPSAVMEINNDITHRKAMEQSLRESEKKFRSLVEKVTDIIYAADPVGVITYISPSVGNVLGYDAGDMVGRKIGDLVHGDDAVEVSRCFKRLGNEERVSTEFRIRSRGDEFVWFSVNFSPIFAQGRLISVQGVCRDITARKKIEAELANEKERLAVTLKSIGDGVIATDRMGRIILINSIAETLTCWNQHEALGRHVSEVLHVVTDSSESPLLANMDNILERGDSIRLDPDTVLITKHGARKFIADSGVPIRDDESRIIGSVFVFRDITEQQKIDRELIKMQKLESIGVLAGGIAHDFNNILAAVLGNISLAMIDLRNGEATEDYLARAEKAALQAKNLANQLLTFAKGGGPVRRGVELEKLLNEAADFSLRGSSTRCEIICAPDLRMIEADPGQLMQIVQNMILNAVDSMPGGGCIRITARNADPGKVKELLHSENSHVIISIEDEGTGMDPEVMERVFDPFFTTKKGGNGLGLAISYRIVRNHRGHIEVESERGKGTVFRIYLPASEGVREEVVEPGEIIHHGKGRVLVMDDDESVAEVAEAMLRQMGYDADLAGEGDAALDLFRAAFDSGEPYFAVITDLTIRGGSGGAEIIDLILSIDPNARVIATSGYTTHDVMANHGRYGFMGVLVKPYTLGDLSAVMKKISTR